MPALCSCCSPWGAVLSPTTLQAPHSPCRPYGPSPEPCPNPSPAADAVPGLPPPVSHAVPGSYLGGGGVSFTSRALPTLLTLQGRPQGTPAGKHPRVQGTSSSQLHFPICTPTSQHPAPKSLAQGVGRPQTKHPTPCPEHQACGCWAHQPHPCTSQASRRRVRCAVLTEIASNSALANNWATIFQRDETVIKY